MDSGMLSRSLSRIHTQQTFVKDFMTRISVNNNSSFRQVIKFDQFLNALFIASNMRYSVHPFVQILATPEARFQRGCEVVLGWRNE